MDGSYELTPGSVYKLTLDHTIKPYKDTKEYALRELVNSYKTTQPSSFSNTMRIDTFVNTLSEKDGFLYVYLISEGQIFYDGFQIAHFNYYAEDTLVKFFNDNKFGYSYDNDTMHIPIVVLNELNIYPVTPPPVAVPPPQPVKDSPSQPVTAPIPPSVAASTSQSQPQHTRRGRSGIIRNIFSGLKPKGGKKSIKRKKTNSRLRRRFSVRRKKHN